MPALAFTPAEAAALREAIERLVRKGLRDPAAAAQENPPPADNGGPLPGGNPRCSDVPPAPDAPPGAY